MNKKFSFEFILGLLIISITIIAFIFVYIKIDVNNPKKNFDLYSDFFNIGGLQIGSDVKINGVIVGEVSDIFLDKESYMATVKSSFYDIFSIPSNSTFTIANNGFIGSPYIEISIGSNNEYLENESFTAENIDAVSLEEIINSFIFK